jgi:AraC-like DNA-binding protein
MKQNEVMSSCLDHVTDWAALDKGGNYCATRIASSCGVTPRQLERHIQAMGRPAPHRWFRDLRMCQAVELIRDRAPLKVVATDLGYKNPSHFAHDFKRYFGICHSGFHQKPPFRYPGGPMSHFESSLSDSASPSALDLMFSAAQSTLTYLPFRRLTIFENHASSFTGYELIEMTDEAKSLTLKFFSLEDETKNS